MGLVQGLHHAEIIIRRGGETDARRFYCDVLGFREIPKPAESLRKNGGMWLDVGGVQIHLSVQDGVDPSLTQAHLAYEVADLAALRGTLSEAGVAVTESAPIEGYTRCKASDPFGNRIEFMQAKAGP